MSEVLGGSHSQVKASNTGKGYHSHHVWAFNSYKDSKKEELKKLTYGSCPAIRMEKKDHIRTESYDNTKDAQNYTAKQRKALEEGNYREAWNMEVKDIRNKFGNKYDQHINQAEKHLLKLHEQGKIKLDDKFKKELEQRQPKVEKAQAQTQTTQNSQQSQQTQKSVFSNNQNLLNQQKGKGRGH